MVEYEARTLGLSGLLAGVMLLGCGATERNPDESAEQATRPALEACLEDPSTPVPFARALPPDGSDAGSVPIVRWDTGGGCLVVTLDSRIAGALPALEQAVAAYNAIECSTLCFTDPVVSAPRRAEAVSEREVHVTVSAAPQPEPVRSELSYRERTGEIVSARVVIDAEQGLEPGAGSLLHELGHVIGLGHASDIESVMRETPPLPGLPTAADEAAICAMYGSDPEVCLAQ